MMIQVYNILSHKDLLNAKAKYSMFFVKLSILAVMPALETHTRKFTKLISIYVLLILICN